MHAADISAEARGIGVFGNGDCDLNVVGGGATLELRFRFEHVLHAGTAVAFDKAFNPDEWLDLGVEAVGHELEFAVWWDE